MRLLFAALVLAAGTESVRAAGTTGLVSREFDLWPTSSALGGSAAAHADALLALWANPAQLAGAPGQVGATHTEWFQDTRLEQLGAVLGGGGRLVVGLSTQLVTTGDIPLRPLSAGGPVAYAAPLDQFEAKDFGVGISAGYRMPSNLSLGASLRWLSQKVYVYDASTFAADLGLSWQAAPALRLAACVNNLGPSLDWGEGVEAQLPLSARAGVAWMPRSQLSVYGDIWALRERSVRFTTGVEWRPVPMLALRGGYVAGQDEQTVSAGTGLSWRGLGFEYALVPRGSSLGTIHRFALHFTPSLHKKTGHATPRS
jgi:hypothetical protein